MGLFSQSGSVRSRLHQNWISSRGVQTWLRQALRSAVAASAQRVADELVPPERAFGISIVPPRGDGNGTGNGIGAHPHTVEGVRALLLHVRETLERLDDVKDYLTIGEVDDDMYLLWKDLERKMQLHRQSEAKFQLREMFRI